MNKCICLSLKLLVAALLFAGYCNHHVSANTQIDFDRYDYLGFAAIRPMLDNFAIQLKNSPGSGAHIFLYYGSGLCPGQVEKELRLINNYMVKKKGIDARRIVLENGGGREHAGFELFVVPEGQGGPPATPSLDQNEEKRLQVKCARKFTRKKT